MKPKKKSAKRRAATRTDLVLGLKKPHARGRKLNTVVSSKKPRKPNVRFSARNASTLQVASEKGVDSRLAPWLHEKSVTQLVFEYLEEASKKMLRSKQRTNATTRLRKFHRDKYNPKLKPDDRTDRKISVLGDKRKLEESVVEVLTMGTILGYLSVGEEGSRVVFRVDDDLL